jgi:hypothetical protein
VINRSYLKKKGEVELQTPRRVAMKGRIQQGVNIKAEAKSRVEDIQLILKQ